MFLKESGIFVIRSKFRQGNFYVYNNYNAIFTGPFTSYRQYFLYFATNGNTREIQYDK